MVVLCATAFACGSRLGDNRESMAGRPNFFAVVSEITLVLLGALLILISITRTVGLPSNPLVVAILGVVLVYWALRAWMRKEPAAARLKTHIRAGSLAIVGLLMITIPFAPLSFANLLVTFAGAALVVRGLAAGLLSLRRV
jgi:hypothetical protein